MEVRTFSEYRRIVPNIDELVSVIVVDMQYTAQFLLHPYAQWISVILRVIRGSRRSHLHSAVEVSARDGAGLGLV